jgi:hypothetical protein
MKIYIILYLNIEYDTDPVYDVKGVFLNKELAIQKAKEIYNNELKNIESFDEYRICADYFNCGFETTINNRRCHISVLEKEINENNPYK